MFITITILILIPIIVIYLQLPRFGKHPRGERLERIRNSPNYKNGSFQNLSYTPIKAEGVSYFSIFKDFTSRKKNRIAPKDEIPSVKTNLFNLDKDMDVLLWFGHSSYFLQIDGKKFLVDPVFSAFASPVSFAVKAFKGTNPYTTDDIPEIDCLLISHDHWDHLDYKTIMKLKPKIKKVVCGLGTGEHFEYWGFNKNLIREMDWNEQFVIEERFKINSVPARHFSGRGLRRNKTLWTSFVLQTPTMKIFIGGDGGYDKHFADIGKTFETFDLAILGNGQHDKSWKYIHLMPDEILKTFRDLNAKRLFAVHSSKFALANHPWDEPLIDAKMLSNNFKIPLLTPMIGEKVNLKDHAQTFSSWWENIR